MFREKALSSKETQFGYKLRKCASNLCKKFVPKYNMLCNSCLRCNNIKTKEHMDHVINRDVNHKHYNKHMKHMEFRKATN